MSLKSDSARQKTRQRHELFQALATAIAAQVGTGNIVGASGAILAGGPGAIFWMWIIAFFGMATIYAEATLAQETRIVNKDGSIKGGYLSTTLQLPLKASPENFWPAFLPLPLLWPPDFRVHGAVQLHRLYL